MKKKIFAGILCLLFVCLCFSSCGFIGVPQITDVDEETAKSLLISCGLIPTVKYESSDTIAKGNVIRTEPAAGSAVKKNSLVTIYISEGPSYVEAVNSYANWWFVSIGEDEWEFYNPYIMGDKLYIECFNVVLAADVKWKDRYNEGKLMGVASVNDTYDKTVPVFAKYTKQYWSAYEPQSFTLEVPLRDLDVEKPTSLFFRLSAEVDGKSTDVEIHFSISW